MADILQSNTKKTFYKTNSEKKKKVPQKRDSKGRSRKNVTMTSGQVEKDNRNKKGKFFQVSLQFII